MARLYTDDGVMARALPVRPPATVSPGAIEPDAVRDSDPYVVSENFGRNTKTSPFENAGVMVGGRVWTRRVEPECERSTQTLGEVIEKTEYVPDAFWVSDEKIASWSYLKGPKSEPRVDKVTGHEYRYSEGGMSFPDPLDRPARTILTGEGGSSPSRFKHVIEDPHTGGRSDG